MVAGIEMAKQTERAEKAKDKFTSTRLFEPDAFELGKLAHKLRLSVAEYFREHFAPQVREHLLKVTREELKQLESRPK